MKDNKGWVFLSHSHLDIEKVRQIRNKFEELGFEPLMFYLKCLNDEDEIEDLIKREINEREWFVYIDSENSRESNWVKTEREYIASLPDKKVFTVDISEDLDKQVRSITRKLKVYISYAHKDNETAKEITKYLRNHDYQVFSPSDSIPFGEKFVDVFKENLDLAIKDGFVILILSKNSLESTWVFKEIESVVEQGGILIPILIEEIDELPFPLNEYQIIRGYKKEEIQRLDKILEKIISESDNINFYNTNDNIND